jgi:nucleoside-diphosphate-sugar epimerase
VVGSLEDTRGLHELVDGVHAIVHCAAAVRGASRKQFERANVSGLAQLVRAALSCPDRPRFLYLSSLAAREPGLSDYAATKREAERTLVEQAGDMRWLALRPPAVYGPGDRELMPLLRWMMRGIAPVLGPRESRMSLLYIDDLVSAVVQWLGREEVGDGRIFELHDGREGGYGWEEVIRAVEAVRGAKVWRVPVPPAVLESLAATNLGLARLTGRVPMLTPGKVRELSHHDWICDNAAFSKTFDWSPQIFLEEGLRRLQAGRRR